MNVWNFFKPTLSQNLSFQPPNLQNNNSSILWLFPECFFILKEEESTKKNKKTISAPFHQQTFQPLSLQEADLKLKGVSGVAATSGRRGSKGSFGVGSVVYGVDGTLAFRETDGCRCGWRFAIRCVGRLLVLLMVNVQLSFFDSFR